MSDRITNVLPTKKRRLETGEIAEYKACDGLVEEYRGHQITLRSDGYTLGERFAFVPRYRAQGGAYEFRDSLEACHRAIDHVEALMACQPWGFPAAPIVGLRFVLADRYPGPEFFTVDFVAGSAVVLRGENSGLLLFVDGHPTGDLGGPLQTGEEFYNKIMAREKFFVDANAAASRDAKLSGNAPLIL